MSHEKPLVRVTSYELIDRTCYVQSMGPPVRRIATGGHRADVTIKLIGPLRDIIAALAVFDELVQVEVSLTDISHETANALGAIVRKLVRDGA